jgi:glycosyltransferase involved in cell wall biosynthesis
MAALEASVKIKHIVWITPGFAADSNDSTCIPTLQDLALAFLKEPSIKLSIIALHYPSRQQHYQWNGIQVYALGGNNVGGWNRVSVCRKLFAELNRLDEELPIQALHSFWLADTSVYTLLWNWRKRKKHLVTLMGQDSLGKFYFKYLPFKRFQCFSLSEYAAQKFKEATGIASRVNSFGLPEFVLPAAEREIHLLTVGAIIPLKNHSYFLELVKEVKREFPLLKAVIIGEHHDKNELEKLNTMMNDEGLSNCVQILDKLTRNEIRGWMNRSKVLVHCAKFESQGMVMQEAMQMGCLVFSSGAGIILNHRNFKLLQNRVATDAAIIIETLKSEGVFEPVNPIPIDETFAIYRANYIG